MEKEKAKFKREYIKKKLVLPIVILVAVILLAVYIKFNNHQLIPNCKEDEALHWQWTEENKKKYKCIPDPNGCHLLIKPGQLRSKECDEREDCYTPCYSSCPGCEDIICSGCLPKIHR